MSNLVNTCMVLNLHVGVWMGYKFDKNKTREITEEADAEPDAARVNKHLIPRKALADIVSCTTQLRHHFLAKTLPWKDNGDRIITRDMYMTFIQEHSALADKFKAAAAEFLNEENGTYLSAQEQAAFRMGEFFDPNDYPTIETLKHKFYVYVDIDGIPTAYDFRLKNDETVLQARVTKAMQGLWEKLREPLEHFAEKMAEDKPRFHNTIISNLRSVVEIIPALNFCNDPNLEDMRVEIERQLTRYEPDDLRKNKNVREIVAGQARDIMDQMAGFMNAFGHTIGETDE